jgi:hypothetical protein
VTAVTLFHPRDLIHRIKKKALVSLVTVFHKTGAFLIASVTGETAVPVTAAILHV